MLTRVCHQLDVASPQSSRTLLPQHFPGSNSHARRADALDCAASRFARPSPSGVHSRWLCARVLLLSSACSPTSPSSPRLSSEPNAHAAATLSVSVCPTVTFPAGPPLSRQPHNFSKLPKHPHPDRLPGARLCPTSSVPALTYLYLGCPVTPRRAASPARYLSSMGLARFPSAVHPNSNLPPVRPPMVFVVL